ncbi:MAG: tRNA (N6-isopentenyl adenosine(37)-C2)-methylthiotransferase MiaB [Chloroflexi bacterium]|nr:tRNA (N6-isopentenyl adenosine(37)-C2)-methylthiotransferase MiaB [Chloroflexota bacterium]
MKYHIQTIGCQMNVADSQRLASALEGMGYSAAADHETDTAEIQVINTCVVRQQAEDKAWGRLQLLKKLKEDNPEMVIGLMGCLVGVKDPLRLRKQVPFVDVFIPPSEVSPLTTFLEDRNTEADVVTAEVTRRARLNDYLDSMAPETQTDLILPVHERGQLVSAHVPVVYGCSHACTFCIIPFRRGVERSRPVGDIVRDIRNLAAQGVKEITLLGQIVDRYGKDIPDGPTLANLLRVIHDVAEEVDLYRIRFLTSHPNWMTDELLQTVAELPRVMPHIEVPIQAGDDEVLANMKRGYTAGQYRDLVHKIRDIIPAVAIHTDIIVGFPGETREQFMRTYEVLDELKLDKAHLARYSPRPGTVSDRRMEDDVPDDEKRERHKMLENLQERVVAEINNKFLGETVEILVEEQHKGKWRGRTPQNKLVFFKDDSRDWKGQLATVEVIWTGPWSMQGRLPGSADEVGDADYEELLGSASNEIIPLMAM